MTRRWPVDPDAIVGAGIVVDVFASDRPPTRDELAARASLCDAIVSSVADRIDRALLDALPNLRIVAQAAVGYDNIDLAACRERTIVTTHTPDVLTESTADLTMAILLALARRVREGETMVRHGEWKGWSPTMLLGIELAEKTLGIIGYGRIGKAVATRARAFGMNVLTASRDRNAIERVLAESDVISIHVPGNDSTRHLIGAPELARMRKDAVIINTSRGTVIDEDALVRALVNKEIGGAGLDVYEHEPRVHPGLIDRADVVLLPHLGSATREARARMASTALIDAARILRGQTALHPIPDSGSR